MAFIFALVLGSSASQAVPVQVTPSATLSVDGQDFVIPLAFDPGSGHWGAGTFDPNTNQFSGVDLSNSEFSASISGELDPDPQISYGISVQDLGAPSAFGFFFSTPIAFPPTANSVNASIAGALNDVNGNGVSITPTLGPNIQIADLSLPLTNMGVDVGPANAHGAASPGAFYTYGSYTAGPQAGPVGAWMNMSLTLGFSLSGGGDIAVLTGLAQIVPEPSSIMLLSFGSLSLLGYLCASQQQNRYEAEVARVDEALGFCTRGTRKQGPLVCGIGYFN